MAATKPVQLSGVAVAASAICSIDPAGVFVCRGHDIAELAAGATCEQTLRAFPIVHAS